MWMPVLFAALVVACTVAVRLHLVVRSYQSGALYLEGVILGQAARLHVLEAEHADAIDTINHLAFAPAALGDTQPDVRA